MADVQLQDDATVIVHAHECYCCQSLKDWSADLAHKPDACLCLLGSWQEGAAGHRGGLPTDCWRSELSSPAVPLLPAPGMPFTITIIIIIVTIILIIIIIITIIIRIPTTIIKLQCCC